MIRLTLTSTAGALTVSCLFFAASCLSGAQGQPSAQPRPAGEPSGAALMQKYGGRPPRPCPKVTGKPTDEQATELVQCREEGRQRSGGRSC